MFEIFKFLHFGVCVIVYDPIIIEGWERLGLYEYFKAKNLARKQKEDDIREGRREKSRSPSPIRRDSSPNGGRSPPRRRYQR
ncbi:unnamed protein product [Allacma fusca]|uniref:DUF7819 domain-containing protein n=1 Tax=Allacma fusca TaxID=39272 RepID=A0A8J2K8N2_9HEXA|nr:unnamed protein product [Allacma fusca]